MSPTAAVRRRPVPVGEPVPKERVEVTTPEGVPVAFTIAAAGDRLAALFVDLVIIALALLVSRLVLGGLFPGGVTKALLVLEIYFLPNLYLIGFELRWQGRTPGKRFLRIRVVDGAGGPLTAEAVLARNLTRNVELLVPFAVLVAPESVWPGGPKGIAVAAGLWMLVFAFLPLFHRRRLRVGDLVAGTMVVREPQAALLGDIGASAADRAAVRAAKPDSDGARPARAFTDAQLDVYGVYELQVLEDVLRRARTSGADADPVDAVYERIRKKIRSDEDVKTKNERRRFLEDFYAALRARLEHRMLLGKRKEDKFAK